MPQKMTTRLKELFNRPQIFVLAGGFGPYGAKMAEFLGYESFYMSGANSSANTIGWPDVGMMSMREMVDNARRIVAAVNIPVFADSDTGYGNAVSVYRTIREYVLAGVAGIHLEDQEHPKKSGSMAGRRCISTEEMIGKLRAAVDARNEVDPDFVICARCDFRGAEGGSFEGVIERCLRYKEVPGVDVVFPEGLQSWEEIKEACRRIPGPVLPLIHTPPVEPHPSLEEQERAGMAAAFYPGFTNMAGNQASWEFMNDFKERGTAAMDELRERSGKSKWGPISPGVMDLPRVRALEEKYLPKELQRDYEHTLGRRPDGTLSR